MTPILLDPEEQRQIENLLESTDPQVQRRARIVLTYHYGAQTLQVAKEVGLSRSQTRYYRHLFELHRMEIFDIPEKGAAVAALPSPLEGEAGESSSLPSPLEGEAGESSLLPSPLEGGAGGEGAEETAEARDARRAAKRVAKRAAKQARQEARSAETPPSLALPSPLGGGAGGEGKLPPPSPLGSWAGGNGPEETADERAARRAARRVAKRAAKQARQEARSAEAERMASEPLTEAEIPPEPDVIEQPGLTSPAVAAPIQERPEPVYEEVDEGALLPSPNGRGAGDEGSLPFPSPLEKSGILPDDPLAEAGRKILLYHFAEMLRHEAGTLLGEEIESLHDMRVATRRMRAALEVFGPAYKPKTVEKHNKGLRAAGRALGCVRDLDVFIEKAVTYVDSLKEANRPVLDPLLANWRAEREQDRIAMIAHLGSKAHARFIQNFNRFVQTPGLGIAPQFEVAPASVLPSATQVRHVAPTLIYTRLAAVRAFETILPTASVPQLHLLRIEFKKLRYTLEFFQEVLGPESRQVITAIKKVQDHLGNLQDAEVTCQRLRQFLDEEDLRQTVLPLAERQSPAGIVTYLAEVHTERHLLITTFPQVWQTFNSPEFQYSLAMSISIL